VLGRGLPRIGKASDQFEGMMVPIPAAVPLRPLTEATESLLYRSAGSTFAIVEKDA